MKFTYYSKKSNNEGKCFFTIRTDNDDEAFRINALTRKYEMYTLLHFNCEVGVFGDSITNIQSARKLYNQIKHEAMNLKEDELVQRYYFTDEDCEEVWECFATPEEAYNKAKELANEYNSTICINTFIGEDIVDYAYPDDEPETEDATPEVYEIHTEYGGIEYSVNNKETEIISVHTFQKVSDSKIRVSVRFKSMHIDCFYVSSINELPDMILEFIETAPKRTYHSFYSSSANEPEETIPAEEPEQPEDVEIFPETETAETTPEQPMAKAFGVRRLEKIIFNCIILHMENSAEIIRALKSDIKKYGIEEVFHYQKISVSNDFVIEKIRVFVPFDDETDLIHLELEVRNLFLKNSRMVVISDKLADKMLDFGFYDINFTLTGTHKTLPCDYVIEKERPDYTPETIPAEEPEQPEDVETVPETASADEPEIEFYIPEFPLPFKEPEMKPQQFCFTDVNGTKLFEIFETRLNAHYIAQELANEYKRGIYLNTVVDGDIDDIVDFVCPDDLPF